ncbi:MAG: hypothetical protein IJ192_10990 [Clostridia bacterium]|nr:hypothetical protein [Clostridia bacterium]
MKRKGFLKRAGVVALAALMTTSAMSLPVFAAEKSDPQYIDKYFAASKTNSFIKNHKDVINTVAEGMFNHKTEIDISAYNFANTEENAQAIFEGTLAAYPEIFFVKGQYSYGGTSNKLTKIIVTYSYSESEIETMLQEFYTEADFYLNQVKGELSVCTDDFSKALLLHDEIVLDAHYVLENSNYNFMIQKQGLCENYSRVYAYLLGQLGIYSELVDSTDMNHEWLKIQLDGKYYNVDVTWDDPTPDHPGRVGHDYFLLSDDAIQNLSTPHYNYESINEATNEKYDNYAYHDFSSKLCKLTDGDIMYAVDDTGVVAYDYKTDTKTTVKEINEYWSAGGDSFWIGKYSGLDTFDGLLYYNTPDAIYSLNPETNDTEKVYTKSGDQKDLYGLRIRNGVLYGVFGSTPDELNGYQELMTLKKDFSDGVGERLAGYSLSLEGNIGVNFYMELDDAVASNDDAYMLFTLPDGATQTVKVSDATKDTKTTNGTTYYVFRCDVAAKRMTDTIKAQIFVGDTAKGKEYEYTVKQYADYLLNNKDKNEKYAKAAELVQSMLNYGAYSQTYFKYNTNKLANEGTVTDEQTADIESVGHTIINKAYNKTTEKLPADVTFDSVNLELESETTLNLYFTNTTGQTLTFKDSEGKVLAQKKNNGYTQVVIPNIAAQNLDDDFTVNISVGGDSNSYSVQYSPLTYCYNVLKRETNEVRTEALKDLVRALYIYNTKANEYFSNPA